MSTFQVYLGVYVGGGGGLLLSTHTFKQPMNLVDMPVSPVKCKASLLSDAWQDTDDNLSPEEAKERKIMRLLLKVLEYMFDVGIACL